MGLLDDIFDTAHAEQAPQQAAAPSWMDRAVATFASAGNSLGAGGPTYEQALPQVQAQLGHGDQLDSIFDQAHGSSGWSWGGMASQFGSGAVEGVSGLAGLLYDLNPLPSPRFNPDGSERGVEWGPDLSFGYSHAMKNLFTDPYLPAPDPQHRYARTAGQFLGPGLTAAPLRAAGLGAGTALDLFTSQASPMALASAEAASVGAQGAQDMFKDSAVAPFVGALLAGAVPSAASNLWSAGKTLITPATAAEVKGSAALALKEATGLTDAQIRAAMEGAPQNSLGSLMSTAELTQNAGMAQLERSLAGSGVPGLADAYNAKGLAREGARNEMLNLMTPVEAVNNEALGSSLIGKANEVENAMTRAEEAAWKKLPRHIEVDATPQQFELSALLDEQQGGVWPKGDPADLIEQFMRTGKYEGQPLTSGAVQDIRSEALRLLREKDLPRFSARALSNIAGGADAAMEENLKGIEGLGGVYDDWLAARTATRTKSEIFNPSTVGGSLMRDGLDPANALGKAFRGTTKSYDELHAAIQGDPQLFDKVKRGVLDSIPRDKDGNLTQASLKKFLAANEEGLKRLFGDEHYGQMQRIFEDLSSEAGVKDLATRASKGGSATAQNTTVAGAINDIAIGSLLPETGVLGKLAVAMRGVFGARNDRSVKELLFKAALEPGFALELSQAPTATRIFNTGQRLMKMIQDGSFYGASAATLEGARTQEKLRSYSREQPTPATTSQTQGSVYPSQSSQSLSVVAPPQAAADKQLSTTLFGPPGPSSTQDKSPPLPSQKQSKSHETQVFDALLNAVKTVEWDGKGTGISSAGAKGPYQLMDKTGKTVHDRLGIKEPYDPFNEPQARRIAEYILKENLQTFDGDIRKALTAYNSGPAAAQSGALGPQGRSYADKVFAALVGRA